MYARMEEADALIESLMQDKDPNLRQSGMYTVAMAYCGTGNNKAIKRLLHVAVRTCSFGFVTEYCHATQSYITITQHCRTLLSHNTVMQRCYYCHKVLLSNIVRRRCCPTLYILLTTVKHHCHKTLSQHHK